jgi:hypothetical protein
MVDSGEVLNSFKIPLNRTLDSHMRAQLHLEEQQFRDVYLSQVNVQTIAGTFWKTNTTSTTLAIDKEYYSSTERLPGNKVNWQSPSGILNEAVPYYTVRIMASNKKVIYQRVYPLIIWIFANVGGIIEIASIIFIALLIMHREVIMEMNLLNSGILEQDINGNMQIQNNQPEAQFYTYGEILKYKYFNCCCSSGSGYKKYDRYRIDLELLEERLDATTIIQNSCKMDVISNSVLQDYHVKLMPRMKNKMEN